MKTSPFFAVVALGSVYAFAAPPARAQKTPPSTTAIRHEIEKQIRAMDTPTSQKDVQATMRFFADDFQGQDMDGSVWNKKQAKNSTIKSYAMAQTIRSRTRIKSVHIENGNAVVVFREHTTGEVVGTKTKRLHTVAFDGTWRSVWTKRSGTWQIWREKHLTGEITRDGVVVPPKPKTKP